MDKEQIEKRFKMLIKFDELYRAGTPKISDSKFDEMEAEMRIIAPKHSYFKRKEVVPVKTRLKACKLPVPMFSMDKVKTIKEIEQWIKANKLEKEEFILTPKFDGLSICADEIVKKQYTRGNGTEGHDVTRLFDLTNEKMAGRTPACYFGEGMIRKKIFAEKYCIEVMGESGFKNPRNMVASLFNPETKSPVEDRYKDVVFVRYGISGVDQSKEEQLRECNALFNHQYKVPYILADADQLTVENLQKCYDEWSIEFEIDGIIIDVNSATTRNRLGRERNNNPKYARAYKGDFEQVARTTVRTIEPQTSKDGYLTPVAGVVPVMLDGALVSNVTLYNYRYVKDNNIGLFSEILIKRSGGVIPKVVKVFETPGLVVKIPKIVDKVLTEWDENEVELRLTKRTDKWNIQELLHFFRIFDIEEFGEPTVRAFYNNGYTTAEKILRATEEEICKIEGFGSKKAKFFLKEFEEKIACGAPISKIMTASNKFPGFGEKTLNLILRGILLDSLDSDELETIPGIGPGKAKHYNENIDKFWEWYEKNYTELIPYAEVKLVQDVVSDKMSNEQICFTGFRDKDLEDKVKANGGKIVDGVSKNTTVLVVKEYGSGSSKEKKAEQLGIGILNREEFLKLLENA